MTAVKQQHYLPQFYLRSFTDERGFLHVVRRSGDHLGPIYESKPNRVCCQSYLHEVKRRSPGHEEEFIEKGSIETLLGKAETVLARRYCDLLRCLEDGRLPGDKSDFIEDLVALISFFVVRSPKWLQSKRNDAADVADRLSKVGFLSEGDIAQLSAEGLLGELEAFAELGIMDAALFSMADGAPMRTLAKLMLDMRCCFLKSVGRLEFATASFPVYFAWASETDELPAGVYFPLNPRFAVVLRKSARSGGGVAFIDDASDELVLSLNRTLMNGSDAWDALVASSGGALEDLAKGYCRSS